MMLSLLSLNSCSKDNAVPETVPPIETSGNFRIVVGSAIFTATLNDTPAAKMFRETLPLTVMMGELNNNEKYYDLPQNLPTSAVRPGTIRKGDLLLYGSNTLVLFYKTFSSSYSYTRIGKVDDPSGMETALGKGSVSVRFELIN